MIIEIDGDIHDSQIEYDNFGEDQLKKLGYKIGLETGDSILQEIHI